MAGDSGTRVSVSVWNNKSSEFLIPVDGSVLFVIDKADPGQRIGPKPDDVYFQPSQTNSPNLSSIPTLDFPAGNVLAFLLCSPHASIQTFKVWSTGNGNLTLGKRQPSQGNINSHQANYLLSYILLDLPTSSGPTTSKLEGGTDLMIKLIFGTSSYDGTPPAPLANITAMYKQVIQSAMKTVLSGTFATVNVMGGYAEEQMVFTSSLGHVIISAIFFAFLTITLVASQFRKGRVPFTFVNVAAALADSDVPQKCVEMKKFKAGTEERKVLKLVRSGDGRFNCAYQSIDQDSDAVLTRSVTLDGDVYDPSGTLDGGSVPNSILVQVQELLEIEIKLRDAQTRLSTLEKEEEKYG